MDQKVYWIGFNLVKGIGAVRVQSLLSRFGSLEAAWKASPQELMTAGLSTRLVENLLGVRGRVDLEERMQAFASQGIRVLTWEDDDYPARLKEIDQAPPVLYARGTVLPEDRWAVAVVGTRRVTSYGRQVAEEIAAALAHSGVTVVSGLARGVDGVAHDAALKAGGRTLAVLGSGVDQIYPPEHKHLAERIIEQGAVLSDYPPGTSPDAANFPPRNRIVSGLSLATVVVEAGETSGALITATFAAQQGRDVFAVPGTIYAPQSVGANRLISEGARPLLKAAELLDVLDLSRATQHQAARSLLPGNDIEAQILQVINLEPVHIDEIRSRLALPIEKVSATLTLMELKGMVRQSGGMNYSAMRETSGEYRTDNEYE